MCLAQGHNAVRLEPAAPKSRVKHSTTEPLRSLSYNVRQVQIIKNIFELKFFPFIFLSYDDLIILVLYSVEYFTRYMFTYTTVVQRNIILDSPWKHCVLVAQKNCLKETVILSTRNIIMFCLRNKKKKSVML